MAAVAIAHWKRRKRACQAVANLARDMEGAGQMPQLISSGMAPAAEAANDARPGTLEAFLAGVERRALRMAEIVTRDRDEALDIVQDAMMNLARHYGRKPAGEWPPLFYRILDNRIRDWQRRQSVKHRVFFWNDRPLDEDEREELVERAPDPSPPVDGRLAQQQAMDKLEVALGLLPGRQREAFMLRIWEGLSVEQTARAMGCSGGSVKTHLSRALSALRERLKGLWP